MKRKLLDTFGRRGDPDYVRVFREPVGGEMGIRVQWVEGAGRKTRTFPDTRAGLADAKGYAKGTHAKLGSPVAAIAYRPVTVSELFDRYLSAHVVDWRKATVTGKRSRWHLFETRIGKATGAATVTREHLDDLKRALLTMKPARAKDPERKRSANQVKMTIETVLAVFRWGVDNDLVPASKLLTYRVKFGRDTKRQVPTMGEFAAEERTAIRAHLNPESAHGWRAWAVTVIASFMGARVNAILHLEVSDIDLEAQTIRWRPETDKMATGRVQPMPVQVVEALRVCLTWRERSGYAGRWVFFRPGAGLRDLSNGGALTARAKERAARIADEPYTYSAYIAALHKAGGAAGVERTLYKGAHAFRRGVVGDLYAMTGSLSKAGDWIGDKSPKVIRDHYVLERQAEMRKLADLMEGNAIPRNSSEDARQEKPREPG